MFTNNNLGIIINTYFKIVKFDNDLHYSVSRLDDLIFPDLNSLNYCLTLNLI